MATHSKTVVSVKFSSVKANLNKCECEGSPSSIQWPSLVWSEKEKNYKKLGKKSKKKNSKFISFEMKNQSSKDSYGCDSI